MDKILESGQLWEWRKLDSEECVIVKVTDSHVEVRYLDSWGNDESNYTYDKDFFLKECSFVM